MTFAGDVAGRGGVTVLHDDGLRSSLEPLAVAVAAGTRVDAGETLAEMKQGVPYFRKAGVEHDVVNANEGEYAFIEIELK